MAKLKVTLSIGLGNAKQESIIDIDDDELAECETAMQKEELMQVYWQDWANGYIDGSSSIID